MGSNNADNTGSVRRTGDGGSEPVISTFAAAFLLGAVLLLPISASHAAPPVPATDVSRPGSTPLPLGEPGKPAEAPLVVPKETAPQVESKTPYGAKTFVKKIVVSGNTVFSDEDLKTIIQPYENRVVASSELEDLRIALTRYYIGHGYINSGAIIPDQKVVDGVVQIKIIEGKLVDIKVTGNKHLDSDYVSSRLKLGSGPPLNVLDLQKQIQIILESPVIATMNSALRPGDRPGEASLVTVVKEGPRFVFAPQIDNRLSPTLGEARLLLPIAAYDLTGHGDILTASAGVAQGLTNADANWSIPLNARDTTLTLLTDYSTSTVERGTFAPLNIEDKTGTVGFRVSHPFYQTPAQKFSMSLGLDLRKSKSSLLGVPFAFTPGVPTNGVVHVSVVRFSQDWSDRGEQRVIAARSQFSFGLDAFGATTTTGDLPSGSFTAWLGQYQWANLFSGNRSQLIFRTNVQVANHPLFSMEQFSNGGALSVRGYRENQIVRDNGYNLSLEYRYPLMKDATGRSQLALAPFFDAGGGNNVSLPNGPDPKFISSAGLGLRWDPVKKVHAEVYWGHAFKDVTAGNESLQDDGIHFLLSANVLEWF